MTGTVDVSSRDLYMAVRALSRIASNPSNDTLPALQHVHIVSMSQGIALVATDRYRLGVHYVPFLGPEDPKRNVNLMIPHATLSRALTMRDKKGRVKITDTGSTMVLNLGEVEITVSDADARTLPELSRIIPDEYRFQGTFNGNYLAASVNPYGERETVSLALNLDNPNKPALSTDGASFVNLTVPLRIESMQAKEPEWLPELRKRLPEAVKARQPGRATSTK